MRRMPSEACVVKSSSIFSLKLLVLEMPSYTDLIPRGHQRSRSERLIAASVGLGNIDARSRDEQSAQARGRHLIPSDAKAQRRLRSHRRAAKLIWRGSISS